MDTATIIGAPHGLTRQVLDEFAGIDYGRWQGRSFAEVERDDPDAFACWRDSPHLAQIPDGESLLQVANRVAGVMRLFTERHPNETILLVGHDTLNKIFLLLALDRPLGHLWHVTQEPCAFNVLDHDGNEGWSVRSINETAHLSGLPV